MNESARIPPAGDSFQYRVGDLLIDTGRQRVTREGKAIALPKLSYDLLIALVRGAPNLLSIDALMGEVWPRLVVSPETVSQRVKLLRDALGDDPRNPRYVEGLRWRGYRLIPTVERTLSPTDETQSPRPTSDTLQGIAERQVRLSAMRSQWPFSRRRWGVLAIVVAGAVIVGTLGIRKITHKEPNEPRASVDVFAVRPRTVAVMPFESLSAEHDNEYIALGMADSILHRLASLPGTDPHRALIVIRARQVRPGRARRRAHVGSAVSRRRQCATSG